MPFFVKSLLNTTLHFHLLRHGKTCCENAAIESGTQSLCITWNGIPYHIISIIIIIIIFNVYFFSRRLCIRGIRSATFSAFEMRKSLTQSEVLYVLWSDRYDCVPNKNVVHYSHTNHREHTHIHKWNHAGSYFVFGCAVLCLCCDDDTAATSCFSMPVAIFTMEMWYFSWTK